MPVSSEVKRGEGRMGHVCTPPPAYLTLELGCEPGCGEGCGGGGIDCGVCTCWPGDGEDSMVRLLWLTWKWRDLASSMLYTHPAQSTHWSDLSSYTSFFSSRCYTPRHKPHLWVHTAHGIQEGGRRPGGQPGSLEEAHEDFRFLGWHSCGNDLFLKHLCVRKEPRKAFCSA